ncbi:hypothetical protein BH24GEM3_BH24GEM3_26860 [soil metagenome]
MTREHLVEDIQNVLEVVNRAAEDSSHEDEARRALQGLLRHIENEHDVPAPVEGCLREAVSSTQNQAEATDSGAWRSARACLETALEFAQRK